MTKVYPKVELHCHLEGALNRAMLENIRQEHPAFPIDPDTFAQAYPVADFDSFLNWWKYITPIWGKLMNFYPILASYITQLKAQHVR